MYACMYVCMYVWIYIYIYIYICLRRQRALALLDVGSSSLKMFQRLQPDQPSHCHGNWGCVKRPAESQVQPVCRTRIPTP